MPFMFRLTNVVPGAFRIRPLGVRDVWLGSLVLVVGVALLEIGAIMCTPILLAALARVGRVLPLGPRLALRDGARQRALYQPLLLPNQVGVQVSDDRAAPDLAAQLKTVLPVTGSFTVRAADRSSSSDAVIAQPVVQCSALSAATGVMTVSPGLCGTFGFAGAFEGAAIVDGALLSRVTGLSDPAAAGMLNQGGAVVFDPALLRDGKVSFDVFRETTTSDAANSPSIVDVPAVCVDPRDAPNSGFLLSPAAATRLGVVGGAPATRRLLAGSTALAITGLGAMLLTRSELRLSRRIG